MSRILLVHGWSFDASLWEGVIRGLPGHRCHTLDLGYYGPARLEGPESPDLVVGHSFGCLWAMQHPSLAGVPLLAVNGFTRFSAAPDFPHGVPVRVLERMLRRLREAPEEVLSAFRERVQGPPPPSGLHLEPLERDLERLLHDDARSLPERLPVAALSADDDPLLSVPMSGDMFPSNLRRLSRGGHLLPLTKPEQVARFILERLP